MCGAKTSGVWTFETNTPATCPAINPTTIIWKNRTRATTRGHCTFARCRRHKTSAENCWIIFILRTRKRPKFPLAPTIKTNNFDKEKMRSIAGLFSCASRCQNLFLRIGCNTMHPFRCILHEQTWSKKHGRGSSFHEFCAKKWTRNQMKRAVHSSCTVLKLVAASAAEAELGELFLNAQEVKMTRLALQEMGHSQPPTPMHCDNAAATGTANGTVKRQRSRAMEMRCFWVFDQVSQKQMCIAWHPGAENLGDHVAKQHPPKHHAEVRSICLHENNSPRCLQRALAPSVVRGCIKPVLARRPEQSRMPEPRSNPCPRHTPRVIPSTCPRCSPRVNRAQESHRHMTPNAGTVPQPCGHNTWREMPAHAPGMHQGSFGHLNTADDLMGNTQFNSQISNDLINHLTSLCAASTVTLGR